MIQITIDDKAIRKALAAAPTLLARELSAEVRRWTVQGSSEFLQKRMAVPDDRNRADFLLRRPRSSEGLRKATGSLARDYVTEAPIVSQIGDLRATTGMRAGKTARIARVHELGTVRYGGTLPDIVPRRAKYLAIPIRGGTASRGTKVTGVVKLLKVGIPPRLGFISFWTSKARVADLKKRTVAAARRALAKAAAKRG